MNYGYLILLFVVLILTYSAIYWLFDEVSKFGRTSIAKNNIFITIVRLVVLSGITYLSIFVYSLFWTSTPIFNIALPLIVLSGFIFGWIDLVGVTVTSIIAYYYSFADLLVDYVYFYIIILILAVFSLLIILFTDKSNRKRNYLATMIVQLISTFAIMLIIYGIDYAFDPELASQFISMFFVRISVEVGFFVVFVGWMIMTARALNNRSELYILSNFEKFSSYKLSIGEELVVNQIKTNRLQTAPIFIFDTSGLDAEYDELSEMLKSVDEDYISFKYANNKLALFIPTTISDPRDPIENKQVEKIVALLQKYVGNPNVGFTIYGIHSHSIKELLIMADFSMRPLNKLISDKFQYKNSRLVNEYKNSNSYNNVNEKISFKNIKISFINQTIDGIEVIIPTTKYRRGRYSFMIPTNELTYSEREMVLRWNNLNAIEKYVEFLKTSTISSKTMLVIPITQRMTESPMIMKNIISKLDSMSIFENVIFGVIDETIHSSIDKKYTFLLLKDKRLQTSNKNLNDFEFVVGIK